MNHKWRVLQSYKSLTSRVPTTSFACQVLTELQDTWHSLIVMDLNMPNMDGFECTRAIRRMERNGVWPKRRPIHIVAATANASPAIQQACKEAGMNMCVPKPITPETWDLLLTFL